MSPDAVQVTNLVLSWPPDERLTLARKILQSLEADATRRPRKPLGELVGALRIGGPPLTDAECDRLLEDELLRKDGP